MKEHVVCQYILDEALKQGMPIYVIPRQVNKVILISCIMYSPLLIGCKLKAELGNKISVQGQTNNTESGMCTYKHN